MRCSALLLSLAIGVSPFPLAIAACTPGQVALRPGFGLAVQTPAPAEPTPAASPLPAPSTAPVADVIAGAEAAGFVDARGTAARFNDPLGLAVAADGGLLVADRLNHRVRRVAPDGAVTTLAGSGVTGFLDGTAATARFQEPTAVVVDAQGYIYVADPFNHRVRRIATDDHGDLTVATLVGGPEAGSADGVGATFDHPYALALDDRHHLFVAERFGQTLRMVTLDAGGRVKDVRTIAGAYERTGSVDGAGATARFARPAALAWDARVKDHTVLLIAEDQGCALRRVDVDAAGSATVSTLNGPNPSCGDFDGPIETARFDRPQGLLVDPTRGLVLADGAKGTLRTFPAAASPLRLQAPGGLVAAPGGALYVTDGNRVRRVSF
ncbi:MAG: repeat containing protein [Cyanobacteria bacterium RYN_339]|nr:repeat containing protein [Cyanobacteria bacterium RYN_339]